MLYADAYGWPMPTPADKVAAALMCMQIMGCYVLFCVAGTSQATKTERPT